VNDATASRNKSGHDSEEEGRRPLNRCARLLLTIVLLLLCWPVAATEPLSLRVAVNSLPSSLGNPFRGNGRPGSYVWSALFDGLTELDEAGALRPALAVSWETETPTVWRFRLREGVRFANGRPFDSEAAASVMRWLLSPEGRRTVVGNELRGVTQVRTDGPAMLVLETTRPDPILPKRLASVMMVEPELWRTQGPDAFALQPVGTGPFVLESWDRRKRRAYATASPHRWRPASAERLIFVELPNSAVRAQALLSHDVDIAAIEIDELPRLERNHMPIVTAPSMQVMAISFRVEGSDPASPLRDRRVRQALNYAIDKEPLARVLLRGLTVPSGQPASRSSFGYDPAIEPYPYDPAKARALLQEAGVPDGFRMRVEIVIDSLPADTLIYQSVIQDWRQIGVEAELRIVTFPQYLKKFLTNSWTVDAFGGSWNSAPYNDALRPMEVYSCRRPQPFFCEPALARELERVEQIFDDGERLAAMRLLARAYRDAAPSAFLVEQIDLFAHSPALANVHLRNRVPAYEAITRAAPKTE
jgi:peptide/nickel transport system substrate-binding protein